MPHSLSRRSLLRKTALHASALVLPSASSIAAQSQPLRLGLIGLVHGHVKGFLRLLEGRKDIQLVGVSEPQSGIAAKYRQMGPLAGVPFFATAGEMLDQTKPEAAVIFTSTLDHGPAVAACARRNVHCMMEKPLAVSLAEGRQMADAARKAGIHLMVNYETTWYPNNQLVWDALRTQNQLGQLRRAIIRDGHQGPKEIGVDPEFLAWLTDPRQNGAGALYDFGCYGANLLTWLLDGQRPLTVSATLQQLKPAIYARVDDEATVILTYPHMVGIIQASWNWPYSRKDMDLYGERGYLFTDRSQAVRVRSGQAPEETRTAPPAPPVSRDYLTYFRAVVRGETKLDGLSGLENNLLVTEILEAARTSAREGRVVTLPPA